MDRGHSETAHASSPQRDPRNARHPPGPDHDEDKDSRLAARLRGQIVSYHGLDGRMLEMVSRKEFRVPGRCVLGKGEGIRDGPAIPLADLRNVESPDLRSGAPRQYIGKFELRDAGSRNQEIVVSSCGGVSDRMGDQARAVLHVDQ